MAENKKVSEMPVVDLQSGDKIPIDRSGSPAVAINLGAEVEAVRGTGWFDETVKGNADDIAENNLLHLINSGNIDYGEIEIPDDFEPIIPCTFYRDNDGIVKHNMDFTQYQNGEEIYVDIVSGDDSSGDGSYASPWKTIWKAIDYIISDSGIQYQIIVKSTAPFFRNEFTGGDRILTDKKISIVQENGDRFIISNGQRELSWTLDGTGTYKATRSNTFSIYDLSEQDVYGVYAPMQNVDTLAECQGSQGTWYTDDTDVWVHRSDEDIPTESTTIVAINILNLNISLYGDSLLYVENIDFLSGVIGDGTYILGEDDGSSGSLFIANNCSFIGGNTRLSTTYTDGDAFHIQDLKNTYLFNCIASYGQCDGFNYHYNGVPENNRRAFFVLEYNCKAYKNGVNDILDVNNATTIHEGVSILRIGTIGYGCKGPQLADVTSCYSICIDCAMRDSVASSNNSAYQFNFNPSVGGKTGKVILKNCYSGGNVGADLQVSSIENGDVFVKRFVGSRINDIASLQLLD